MTLRKAGFLMVAAVLLLVATGVGRAMIITLPLRDLTRRADVVVIAQVEKIETVSVDGEKIATVRNLLKPESILKGKLEPKAALAVLTVQRGAYGEEGSLEDQVEFPAAGQRVLVFLQKNREGNLDLVNGLQGMWPIQGEEFLGFGLGVKLQEVQDSIGEARKR